MSETSALVRRLDQLLATAPDAVAIAFFSGESRAPRTCTWHELDLLARRYATRLAVRDVRAGDRVAVMAPTSIELVAALVAHLRLGVTHIPVNHRYRPDEVDYIVAHSEAKLLLTDLAQDAGAPMLAAWPATPPDETATALIVYTSGTTGRPKGVITSHRALAANLGHMMSLWRVTPDDVLSLALPLFHVHGLGLGILGAVVLGGARVRLHARFDPATVVADFAAPVAPATLFMGVPTMYHALLGHLAAHPEAARELARGRLFTAGSAALSAADFERFRALTGHAILERYGMTETGFTLSNPYNGERRPGTVGLPVPGARVRVVDGEIEVQGAALMDGYWRDPEATAAAFRDGWFKTGDVAEVDGDGYYRIVGRASTDIIKSGGFKVGAREIEDVLRLDPRIGEAAVIGVPDPKWGEVVAAVIVAAPGAALPDEAALLTELAALADLHLADYKRPRRLRIAASLPRNAMGKVQKPLLRGLFEEPAAG